MTGTVGGFPVLRPAFGLRRRSEIARIVAYVYCQIRFQSSSDSFDQTKAGVFHAEALPQFPGDVDFARQVHHRRMTDSQYHGAVVRIPNLETAQAESSPRDVYMEVWGSSQYHGCLER